MPGLRDILLVLLVLAAVYLVVMLIRLTRVGGRKRPLAEPASQPAEPPATESPLRQRGAEPAISPDAALAAYETTEEAGMTETFAVRSAPSFEWDDVKDLFGEAPAEAVPPARAPQPVEPPRQGGFGEALADHLARSDVEAEMRRMRDEMERMRVEMEEMRSARRVSPQYADAMELAQRGCSAQDVADRLGISLAEAELVHALSRSRQNFDEGEEHGANGNPAGFDEFGGRRTG